jgi:hypothetical protein
MRYINGRNIENVTNSTITAAVRVVTEGGGTTRDLDSNLDPGNFHFASVPDATQRRYQGPKGAVLLFDAPRTVKSWGAQNFWLKSVEGRIKYGADNDAKRCVADFSPLGALLTYDEPQNAGNRPERVATFATEKRARIPDLFAADGKVAPRAGCKLYAVWMRHDLNEAVQSIPENKALLFGQRPEAAQLKVPSTYWQIHAIRRAPGDGDPSTMLYITTEWTGDCKYIGLQTDTHWKPNHASFQGVYARKALFPDLADPECRRKDANCLHEIDVQLNVK